MNWLVSTEVQTISTAQRQVFEGMGTLANSYKSNRMVQNINSRTLYTINKGDVEVVGSGVSSIESSDSDDWKIIVGIMVPLFVIIIVLLILLLVCFLKGKN